MFKSVRLFVLRCDAQILQSHRRTLHKSEIVTHLIHFVNLLYSLSQNIRQRLLIHLFNTFLLVFHFDHRVISLFQLLFRALLSQTFIVLISSVVDDVVEGNDVPRIYFSLFHHAFDPLSHWTFYCRVQHGKTWHHVGGSFAPNWKKSGRVVLVGLHWRFI